MKASGVAIIGRSDELVSTVKVGSFSRIPLLGNLILLPNGDGEKETCIVSLDMIARARVRISRGLLHVATLMAVTSSGFKQSVNTARKPGKLSTIVPGARILIPAVKEKIICDVSSELTF